MFEHPTVRNEWKVGLGAGGGRHLDAVNLLCANPCVSAAHC